MLGNEHGITAQATLQSCLTAPRSHVYKEVKLDGTLEDVLRGMQEIAHNKDVLHWGLRAIMDYAKIDG